MPIVELKIIVLYVTATTDTPDPHKSNATLLNEQRQPQSLNLHHNLANPPLADEMPIVVFRMEQAHVLVGLDTLEILTESVKWNVKLMEIVIIPRHV
jgi:hypothetical protein